MKPRRHCTLSGFQLSSPAQKHSYEVFSKTSRVPYDTLTLIKTALSILQICGY